MLNIYWR